MSTSGSNDFNLTRNELIKSSLRLIGAIDPGETPSNAEIKDASEALNIMMKSWQTERIGLWLYQDCFIFVESGKQSYLLGPSGDHACTEYAQTDLSSAAASGAASISVSDDSGISSGDHIGVEADDGSVLWTTVSSAPVDGVVALSGVLSGASASGNAVFSYSTKMPRPKFILEARYFDGSMERAFPIVHRNDYYNVTQKDAPGHPVIAYCDPQLTNAKLYVWPVPEDETHQVRLSVKIPIEDMDSMNDNAHFPTEWLKALKYNLAVDLAPEYQIKLSQNDPIVIQAVTCLEKAKHFDTERSPLRLEIMNDYYKLS